MHGVNTKKKKRFFIWNSATWMPTASGFLQSSSSSNAVQLYHLSTAYKTGDVWMFSFNGLFM
jgi:hypothetical protein